MMNPFAELRTLRRRVVELEEQLANRPHAADLEPPGPHGWVFWCHCSKCGRAKAHDVSLRKIYENQVEEQSDWDLRGKVVDMKTWDRESFAAAQEQFEAGQERLRKRLKEANALETQDAHEAGQKVLEHHGPFGGAPEQEQEQEQSAPSGGWGRW